MPVGESVTRISADRCVERIALDAHSWVDVVRAAIAPEVADDLHHHLACTASWQQGRVFRYERWLDEPRLGAFHRGADRHERLVEVEDWVTRTYRARFDGYALARYRDGRDSVAWHRDREMKWLDDTVIAVLTLGAARPWLMRPLTGRRSDDDDLTGAIDLAPASGDLLVMGGRCQAAWLHAVPKVRDATRSRISVQWRWTSRRGRPDTNPSYFAPRHFSR